MLFVYTRTQKPIVEIQEFIPPQHCQASSPKNNPLDSVADTKERQHFNNLDQPFAL